MLWIPLTLAAAFVQNLRSMLQKRLTGRLSVNGAAYVRFCYALPFAWVYLVTLGANVELPVPTAAFWAFAAIGSLGQLVGTACLMSAFTHQSFAVSTALSKTEVIQAAAAGALVLGDALTAGATVGVVLSLVGVLLLGSGLTPRDVTYNGRGVLLGLLAGTGFAVSAVGFRGASLALPEGTAMVRAAVTLAAVLSLQTLAMGAYLALREPGQLRRVAHAWRNGVWVGLCGAAASAGWFTAMTLQAAALVRALGQVELLFALMASGWVFRERVTLRELTGMAALVGGIWLIL